MTLNCRMIGEDVGGTDSSVIEELVRSTVRLTEEHNENLGLDSKCPDRDTNRELSGHKFLALPLYHRARFRLLGWKN